jgi:hypothetical protein
LLANVLDKIRQPCLRRQISYPDCMAFCESVKVMLWGA